MASIMQLPNARMPVRYLTIECYSNVGETEGRQSICRTMYLRIRRVSHGIRPVIGLGELAIYCCQIIICHRDGTAANRCAAP
jgi:hypothetical protein